VPGALQPPVDEVETELKRGPRLGRKGLHPSPVERQEADLEWLDGSWMTPPDFARMVAEYDRLVSV
jgi:hypothetical protein